WAEGHNRYEGTVAQRLAESAARIRQATGAELVIFGHTHREELSEGYANTGSFAFPRSAPGRPYLEIEGSLEAPRAARRYWPAYPCHDGAASGPIPRAPSEPFLFNPTPTLEPARGCSRARGSSRGSSPGSAARSRSPSPRAARARSRSPRAPPR